MLEALVDAELDNEDCATPEQAGISRASKAKVMPSQQESLHSRASAFEQPSLDNRATILTTSKTEPEEQTTDNGHQQAGGEGEVGSALYSRPAGPVAHLTDRLDPFKRLTKSDPTLQYLNLSPHSLPRTPGYALCTSASYTALSIPSPPSWRLPACADITGDKLQYIQHGGLVISRLKDATEADNPISDPKELLPWKREAFAPSTSP
ncbi:hypothetical protein NPX13_g6525 [Xylaria arbuscula]|uniref:Uncharacterized protein n=1 Tax=Xylaria arbuscula TaxID=114810 RepID=A0A9W8TLN7_9PEZI|nr:hypothetical protein NPX13_g6525 [Xylaria arbuscula]